MRELLPDLENWLAKGERVALATVLSTWGSAPRLVGSTMAVSESGGLVGSVSGGCVEGAVIHAAREVIQSGKPQRLHFSVTDDTAWGVGLACGGEIELFVQPVEVDVFNELLPRLKADQNMLLSTVVKGSEGELGSQLLTDDSGKTIIANGHAPELNRQNGKEPKIIKGKTGNEIFANPLPASPTLVMIGGVHIAIALAKLAHGMNFRTVIVDPRKAFATTERFGEADKLIQAWPQAAFEEMPLNSSSAVASLSHDPKLDDPALIAALQSPAFYVGALGSKKNQERRRERLLKAGVKEKDLDRLHAPIGIEIGAETPEEIALAIMAEVVAAYRKR